MLCSAAGAVRKKSDNISIAVSKMNIITIEKLVYIGAAGNSSLEAFSCLLKRREAGGKIG